MMAMGDEVSAKTPLNSNGTSASLPTTSVNSNGAPNSNDFPDPSIPNQGRKSKILLISFLANVFLLGLIFCWVILQMVRDSCDTRDDPQGNVPSATPDPEEMFYSCSPCSPMMKAEDADVLHLSTGNTSYICCKMIKKDIKLEVPNTGQLLEECRAKAGDNSSVGALLYINPDECSKDESGLHWSQVKGSSYIKGGIEYEDMMKYGKLIVPSDGIYVVYSYIQFDSYTGESTLDRTKPAMIALYKNEQELVHMNKFMLRQHSYTTSQVGPIFVPLKARDEIHVAVSNAKIIYNDPQSSVFGINKL
ncbi:uncharacterized protein LOC133202313 [Saccostrea echinata]|uniref:uncharacterized protein LOC133202313 n=1 Tax=Saccostrea echinata TaxID=191078 RepID=UPI002A806774|nr:uncharacterized protein LOC133202313 [Saccostrea echinata]